MSTYTKAPESVVELIESVIEQHRPHLLGASIGVLFFSDPKKSKGQLVYGKASKPSKHLLVYKSLDLILEFWETAWHVDLSFEQQTALVDHELCHCKFDDESGEYFLIGHDFEEFREIIERYGFWNQSLLMARKAFREALQIVIPGMFDKPKQTGGAVISLDINEAPGIFQAVTAAVKDSGSPEVALKGAQEALKKQREEGV